MASSSPSLPSIAVIGPLVGSNQGLIPTQGEFLARKFREAGNAVVEASSARGRLARLVDVVSTILRVRGSDIQCLQVYGERSFVVEDVASFLGKICGQRVVMILRGGTLPTFMDRFPRWSRRVLSRADALVTPSSYMAREVGSRGFEAEVIPNVIDISKYPYRERHEVAPRLVWMRSFYSYYNPCMAVNVLVRLKETHPGATLVMAGPDKGDLASVCALARDRGVASAVRFADFLDPEAKTREFGAADVYLNTNTLDNMPVSILEAAAMGLPVVATDVGGIRDFLSDGENALLTPSNDHHAMADAVLRLIREPALAHRLSVNGRTLAEQCSWEVVGPRFERLFASVLAKGAVRRIPLLHVVQASVFALPFADACFDVVYRHGVIHHTHSAREAFARLARLPKRPGGMLYVWVYSADQEKATRLRRLLMALERVVRPIIARLPLLFRRFCSHRRSPST